MEETKDINSKEIILPKLWVLILGILSAVLFPPIGIIWGIFLLVKKYRSIGITLIGGAIISTAIGALIVYKQLIFKNNNEEFAVNINDYPVFNKGDILPKNLQKLQMQKSQNKEILTIFKEEALKDIVSIEQAQKLLRILEGSLKKLSPEQTYRILELLEEIEKK
ncbi:MAG: hypothetical protein M1170_00130 [Patescibacteria group bacterium]|nr:hypothetical protein [Patescibacteria group bacterium]